MSFVDPAFLFGFLPIVFVLSIVAVRLGFGYVWLIFVSSLVFFAWFKPVYIFVLLSSILANYFLAIFIQNEVSNVFKRKAFLVAAIVFNLSLLFFFKYFNFFLENVALFSGNDIDQVSIILPIGISFFTFQQIAYVVDVHRGDAAEVSFHRYGAFVSFFPQLIAGPIVRHRELLPQLQPGHRAADRLNDIAVGLIIISIGLFKKVIIADNLGVYVDPVFSAAETGGG